MADISVRGFVSRPATKKGQNGDFSTFTLAEGVKGKDGKYINFFYNVTNYKSASPPEDGSRVQIKGWQKLRYFEKGGVKQVSLDVQAEEIEVLDPPRNKPDSGGPGTDSGEKDPWDS